MQHPFIDYLSGRVKEPLPGWKAQLDLAPRPADPGTPLYRPKNNGQTKPEPQLRRGAVLCGLLPGTTPEALHLLLTLRSSRLSHHGGQVSFPGGGLDPGETAEVAALREAHEEIGLSAENVQLIGRLTELYIPPTQNLAQPVLGWIPHPPPTWVLNPQEVEEVFTVDLDHLCQPGTLCFRQMELRNRLENVPYFDVHPTTPLWGATAMMVNELLVLYREWKG
jgi:8-oxo-dGTP pyrophosphatase MutT (NUDIX family)